MNNQKRIVAFALACAVGLGAYFAWSSLPPSLPKECRSACGQNDKPLLLDEQIAISLVSWIVDDKKLPGFDESYADKSFMSDRTRFIVTCDFVRDDLMLSDDERVYRIESKDFETVFDKLQYDGHDYISISVSERTDGKIRVWFTNYFSFLAGHGYEFIFEIEGDSFTVSGECVMVS